MLEKIYFLCYNELNCFEIYILIVRGFYMSNNIVLSNIILYDILAAHKITVKAEMLTNRKNRPCWAMAIKLAGSTEYTCKHKKTISNAQSVILLPKGIDYTWVSHGGECIMIEFECNVDYDAIVDFSVADNKIIAELAEKIERIRAKNDALSKVKSMEWLYKIFVILVEKEIHYIPSAKAELIRKSIDYIHGNYSNPRITISYLSDISDMSEIYFRKIFTTVYGISPMKYVNIMRMNKAKEILGSDYNTIESVANSVGYSNVYHFSKMFKQYFGTAPSNFAKGNTY